ncbi:MAG: ATP-binding protein [Bacteroidota bacterium]
MPTPRTATYEAQTRLFFEIANLTGLSFHEKVLHVLSQSARLLGMQRAFLNRVTDAADVVEVASLEEATGLAPSLPLVAPYGSLVLEADGIVAIEHVSQSAFADQDGGAQSTESFIGAPVYVSGDLYGTVSFSCSSPRGGPFSDADLNLVLLLASWVGAYCESVRAMETVRKTAHRIESVLDTVPDAALVTGEDRRIGFANVAAETIFGYPPEDLVGKTPRVLYANPDDYDSKIATRFSRTQPADRTPFIAAYRRADGSTFLGETVGGPINDEGGYIGLIRDVTARETERTARARAEARAEAAEARTEAIRSKERFLANMSHEMRTPLNAVLGLGHLLADTPLSSNQADLLSGITTSADALLGLIDDLLDFARLGAGQLPFESIPFSPVEIMGQVETMLRPRAMEKSLLLATSVAPGVPDRVLGDPSRFRQILMNLASNAVKFTSVGSVTMALQVSEADGTLHVDVSDTGIGIPPSRLGAIFDPFTQATDDAARRYGGTGLGLAIVKDLVERQEGTIEVDSVEGAGSTFRVMLPLAVPTSVQLAADNAPELEPADLTGLRVLVAEDNEMNRLVARRTLQSWGVDVTEACDGHEAVRAVTEAGADRFDLVLMDLQMPDLDGIAASRILRHEMGIPSEQLPIVALTASVLAYQRSDVIDAGLDDFLLKPFEPRRLRERIGVWTGRTPETLASSRVASLDAERFAQTCLGDAGLAQQVTDLFLTEGLRLTETIAQTAVSRDFDELEQAAHALKGQAGYVGAFELARTAERIVGAVRAGTTETLRAQVQTVLRQYRTAANELKQVLAATTG